VKTCDKTRITALSGNLQTQQLFRHPEPGKWSIIQQRNVARVRVEYDWIQAGWAFGDLAVPWIQRAHFVALYRGVYDSVYDFQPGPRQEAFRFRRKVQMRASEIVTSCDLCS